MGSDVLLPEAVEAETTQKILILDPLRVVGSHVVQQLSPADSSELVFREFSLSWEKIFDAVVII